ncbi:hypothetical protein ACUNHW_25020 [Serratia sp. IR-2025]
MTTTQGQITSQQQQISNQRGALETNHTSARDTQNKAYADEKQRQGAAPGAKSQDELTKRAIDMQEKFNKERGGK